MLCIKPSVAVLERVQHGAPFPRMEGREGISVELIRTEDAIHRPKRPCEAIRSEAFSISSKRARNDSRDDFPRFTNATERWMAADTPQVEATEFEERSPFYEVPDDIIVRIACFLEPFHDFLPLALTCRRFRRVVSPLFTRVLADLHVEHHPTVPFPCIVRFLRSFSALEGLCMRPSNVRRLVAALSAVAESGASLRSLAIAEDRDRLPQIDQREVEVALGRILQNSPGLRVFQVEVPLAISASSLMTDVLGNLKNLTTLVVSRSRDLTDDMLIGWNVWSASSLTVLSVYGCRQVTDRAIEFLAARNGQMRVVNVGDGSGLSRITDASVLALARHCPLLESVTVPTSEMVTDVSVMELARACPRLRIFNAMGCRKMTDAAVLAMAQGWVDLESLTLCACPHITDRGLIAIAARCKALRILNVGDCPLITDVGLTAIASQCRRLQSLTVCGCRNITDASLQPLSRFLRILNIGGSMQAAGETVTATSPQVTDQGLMALFARAPYLLSVSVRGNGAIRVQTIEALARHCTQLRKLDVRDCHHVSHDVISRFAASWPFREKSPSERQQQKAREFEEDVRFGLA